MSIDTESNLPTLPIQTPSELLPKEAPLTAPCDMRTIASGKKADLQHNYQIIAVVSTLLGAVASTLLTPIGNESNYKRYQSMLAQDATPVSLSDLRDRLLAACYTSLILSIEATCLTCYLKYRLSTLTDIEICRIWRHPDVNVGKLRPCIANYEIRALSVIFWFCFVSAILLIIGTILVYMYWQLPPIWFYIWSSFSMALLILFLPLLALRLYRTITGTDYATY